MSSNVPSEPYAIDDGYEDDPVKAYDVTWNQKTAATSNGRDHVRWDTTRTDFIRSHSGFGSDCGGRRRLGVGFFGMAGLWAKRGDNVIVIMVKKIYSM